MQIGCSLKLALKPFLIQQYLIIDNSAICLAEQQRRVKIAASVCTEKFMIYIIFCHLWLTADSEIAGVRKFIANSGNYIT